MYSNIDIILFLCIVIVILSLVYFGSGKKSVECGQRNLSIPSKFYQTVSNTWDPNANYTCSALATSMGYGFPKNVNNLALCTNYLGSSNVFLGKDAYANKTCKTGYTLQDGVCKIITYPFPKYPTDYDNVIEKQTRTSSVQRYITNSQAYIDEFHELIYNPKDNRTYNLGFKFLYNTSLNIFMIHEISFYGYNLSDNKLSLYINKQFMLSTFNNLSITSPLPGYKAVTNKAMFFNENVNYIYVFIILREDTNGVFLDFYNDDNKQFAIVKLSSTNIQRTLA